MRLPCCPSCKRHVRASEAACPFCGNRFERASAFARATWLAAVPLALAACQPAANPPVMAPVIVASGVPSVAPSPVPAPSASPSPAASPSPTPLMTPYQYPSAPAPAYGKVTIASGTVYDETGATVDGALIKVTSLDASVPYTASTTTSQGTYVVNNLPEGANVEIVASKDGWTSRRRVGAFQTEANRKNEVNFGGTNTLANGAPDPGQPFFISDYPEIAAVDPGYDARNVDGNAVSYKLTLSEPLFATNRDRFANALRLFPANRLAAPENDGSNDGAGYRDLRDRKITAGSANPQLDRPVDPDPAAAGLPWDYSIKNGTTFQGDATTRASVTWDDTGKVATLSFPVPLVADHVNPARYQVGLVAGRATDRIVDDHNLQLGMDASGSQASYPLPGNLIHATIKQPELALAPGTPTSTTRWIATHQDAAPFDVKVDAEAPKLLAVAYTAYTGLSSRFELTFSKPLAAYNGRPGGHVGDAIRTGSLLDALSMVVSDRPGGTANVDLKGGQLALNLDPSAGPFGAFEQEFKLKGGSSAAEPYGTDLQLAERDATKAGRYLLAINPTNPRTLYIYLLGRTHAFDQRTVELKARTPGITDQAGNILQPADADKQQVTTSDFHP